MLGDILLVFVFVLAAAFTVVYVVLFNPRKTTGGWLIWQAIFSVACLGLVAMVAFYAPDAWWRPGVRVIVCGLAAYNFARLVIHLLRRRFAPSTLGDVDGRVENTLSPRSRPIRRKR